MVCLDTGITSGNNVGKGLKMPMIIAVMMTIAIVVISAMVVIIAMLVILAMISQAGNSEASSVQGPRDRRP